MKHAPTAPKTVAQLDAELRAVSDRLDRAQRQGLHESVEMLEAELDSLLDARLVAVAEELIL